MACGGHFSDALALWPQEIRDSSHGAAREPHRRAVFPLRLKGASSYPFTALVPGDKDRPLAWIVDGISGGDPLVGTISPAGVYQAPRVDRPHQVRISVSAGSGQQVETAPTVMPVTGAVPALRLAIIDWRVSLSWDPAPGPVAGYTVWKRIHVGALAVDTIFELVGAVGPECTAATYPDARIRHFEDHHLPIGYGSHVRAWSERRDPSFTFPSDRNGRPGWLAVEAANPNAFYGFGPLSPVAVLTCNLSTPPP